MTQDKIEVDWQWSRFEDLKPKELYAILKARQEVFVIEQHCVYLDLDGHDEPSLHLTGRLMGQSSDGTLLAYLRLVPPGEIYAEPSIGRVITTAAGRGKGVGARLMTEGVRKCEELYPKFSIRIGAQRYLEKFYHSFGFETVSDPYDEDGILHVKMLRQGNERPL